MTLHTGPRLAPAPSLPIERTSRCHGFDPSRRSTGSLWAGAADRGMAAETANTSASDGGKRVLAVASSRVNRVQSRPDFKEALMNRRTAATGIILGGVGLLVLAAAVPWVTPAPIKRQPTVSVEFLAQPADPQLPLAEFVTTASRLPPR